ncbi:MAG: hypothetical protein GX621_05860 [Pirellulaceae bacterium]|nr:hypothetical protein [Pirellulaceae bacterium]
MHAVLLIFVGLMTQASTTASSETAAERPTVVVVRHADFQKALAPWVSHRQSQGYDVRLVSNAGTPEQIRRRIRQVAPAERIKFLVLVGDMPTAMDGRRAKDLDPAAEARCVPAPYEEAKIIVRWGPERVIPNDAWYADLDDDGVPDVALGRLPVASPEQLERVVAKILAYEKSTDFGPWRRQLNFVAGVGGFGPMIDMAIDRGTQHMLRSCIPADFRVSMTQANWQTAYCPDPRRINETTIDRLNDGAFFWTYMGHGQQHRLGGMKVPGARYPLLANGDASRLAAERGPSIALFLACYVGAIDSRPDCLAEELLRSPGGPVAVVASSRVAMPYSMAVMGMGLMEQVFERQVPTLGEAMLHAKRGLVLPGKKTEVRTMVDSLASLVSPTAGKLDQERAEHVVLFNLIGDPCLRIRYPAPITLTAAPDVDDRTRLVVEGRSPLAGRAVVELARPLGKLGFPPPRRTAYPNSHDALAEFDATYLRANNSRVSAAELPVAAGAFRTELTLPDDLAGVYQVRAFVEGSDGFGSGTVEVRIGEMPEAAEPPATSEKELSCTPKTKQPKPTDFRPHVAAAGGSES